MIHDRLENAARYEGLHHLLPSAFAYLRTLTPDNAPREKIFLDERKLFVVPFAQQGLTREASPLEAHARYADVHFLIEGSEEIGIKQTADCRAVKEPFDPVRDLGFFGDAPDNWIALCPGDFLIVWPGQAHAPMVARGAFSKVVIKLLV